MKTEKAAAAKRKAHSLPFPIVRPHPGAAKTNGPRGHRGPPGIFDRMK
jgi:hypothetical protein